MYLTNTWIVLKGLNSFLGDSLLDTVMVNPEKMDQYYKGDEGIKEAIEKEKKEAAKAKTAAEPEVTETKANKGK